jgi:HK97 family phage prohead protease
MSPEPTLERRAILELRADHTKIVGHAIVFNVRSEDMGGFVEVVRPSAVDRALQPSADIRALYAHDPAALLGRTPKTLQLAKDAKGLAFTLDPANTSAGRDAFELVRRGDVSGASFGFKTVRDAWRQDGRVIVRELLDIEVYEISLVSLPSYPQTDVNVALRSLQGFRSNLDQKVPRSIAALRRQLRVR